MKLDEQNERAQKLARDIADLICGYEQETKYRVEWIGLEQSAVGMYDVQVKCSLRARSLDTFTHKVS